MGVSGKLAAAGPALLFGILAISRAAADAPSTASHDPGIWQQHKYSFVFMGFTSTYSCDGLADKLKLILIASGARPDVKSQPAACASGFGQPDKFARADLTFYTLAPAGAAKEGDGRIVEGTLRTVAISRRSPREIDLGDCELIEQFKASLLPMFTTRNIENRTTCIPHQDSGSVIDLKFDSFTAVPAKPARTPAVAGRH